MAEFCTLFDVNYLPRGLVLYRSLGAVTADFRLRVFCMDGASYDLLRELDLPRLEPIPLAELEEHDPELRAVKATRDQVEYFWTATPAVCLHALEREPELEAITYLDADLMFFATPAPLFDELGEDSVLIVPHRFSPRYRVLEELSGVYNVEWLTFRRTDDGLRVLRWWRERCLEWCYRRHEDGKFGDQKYLDDWPERFPGVHVAQHVGAGLAPWNGPSHVLERRDRQITVDGRPLIFYHFHALRLYSGITPLRRLGILDRTYRLTRGPVPLVWQVDYELTEAEVELVWEPYMRRLAAEIALVRDLHPEASAGFERVAPRSAAVQLARERLPGPVRAGIRRVVRLVR